MSGLMTFLRPLAYDRTREILLVQTGPGEQVGKIVSKLREEFPGATVDVLLRETDGDRREAIGADNVRVATYDGRHQIVRTLREKRWDAVALQLGGQVSAELKTVPFLLRTRSILAFNESADYFPLNVFRLSALAQHVTGGGEGTSILWMLRYYAIEAAKAPLVVVYLLASLGRLRLRRMLGRGRAGLA